MPVEKSWGPDYLRLGLQLDSNLSQGSTYQLRAGYQKTWLNPQGGELLLTGELGNRTGAAVAWFQPLSLDQGWFFDSTASWSRAREDYFYLDQRIAEYSTARTQLGVAAGISLQRLGELRAGWRFAKAEHHLETGLDIFSLAPNRSVSGPQLSLDLDRFDRLYFPRSGWSAQASWFDALGAGYSRQQLDLRAATPLAEYVLGARLSWVGSARGRLPLPDAARLGGFLNLTGYATGQLIGDDVVYGHLRAERIIGHLPLGLRGDMRIGLALEAGRLAQPFTLQQRNGWLGSLAVYLGGETPIGPAYVGLGRAHDGTTNAYLFVGTP
jgi:NTE family protein